MERTDTTHRIQVEDYDLAATVTSGQAFRWRPSGTGWESAIQGTWVRIEASEPGILTATTATRQTDWRWLEHYLQSHVRLADVIATFPPDPPLLEAVQACPGLRLLRQDPWECLAGFILSSTKQIVQIQQCIELLCERAGQRLEAPPGSSILHAFPSADAVAQLGETALRECKMGFRAPYLLNAARRVAEGSLDLEALRALPTAEARDRLVGLHGVGRKIADCVLLFAYGRQDAFPADVWILKVLRHLYFPKRAPSPRRLLRFVETHFGSNAGYAQQFLFHHARVHLGSSLGKPTKPKPKPRTPAASL